MRLIALLILALGLAFPSGAETVRLGDRWYDIFLPDSPRGAPLILALHGGGGDPDQFASSSGFARAATRAGYAVVFPAGSGRRSERLLAWNSGYCCGYAARRGIDDIGFLAQVIADAASRYGVDGDGVYLTGMSNGSMMVETFAALNPRLVKAVAGVAGTMDTDSYRVRGQVPLLVIHGTADANVPYTGGVGSASFSRADYASVSAVVQAFLAPWGPVSEVSSSFDRKDDGTSVIVTDYDRRGMTVLRLITVEGGGHHWPGGRKARLTEGKTQEIDANTEILRFFALHP